MMGKNKEALALLLKARKLSQGQDPFWIARLDYMQSLQHIVLGEKKEAIELFERARKYHLQADIEQPQTMKRISTYLAFMSGNISLGVTEAEKIRLDDIKIAALERDESFFVIRDLVEQEKATNLLAKQSNEYLKYSVVVLILLLLSLLLVFKRQQKISRILRESQKKLERFARKDGLTQLYNRQYWEERFAKEHSLLARNANRVSSLIMFDIDYFKKINDQFGHLAGDAVLREISKILEITVRKTDLCGRYGGEEFVILLMDTKSEEAGKIANLLKDKIESTEFSYKGALIKMTISIGVGQYNKTYQTYPQWIDAVDKALYQAKDDGRNKVVTVHKLNIKKQLD